VSRKTAEERFWSKVDLSGPLSPQDGTHCWLWTASLSWAGYGRFPYGKRFLAHVVSYEWEYGEVPQGKELDHRYTCPKKCVRPLHLRATTHKQNHENRGVIPSNNTSGIRGVTWNKKLGKWQAQTKHNGKYVYVGVFLDLESAGAAVIAKRLELFTHNDADRVSS
jgi:hypothetical protein